MSDLQTWYIVKRSGGNCEIIPSDQVGDNNLEILEQWGPFTQEEAIARRVGLIRAGKCQPV
ncbi:DDE transposase family protein [Nostoc sp. LPT]|uniref:DDE transposase family protein n=1 Tax=Nostoc sp. LPT TaxID=2815387 RepID=UPI001E007B92|nr:DDE transposase family protein [Nostoc sp. LPT]MBN4006842.1 transposase [Nostoc sp. LPT]